MLSHATADSAWLLKQLENGSSRHGAFEADRDKHAYLHSGLQAGLQAYPRQWASNREGGTSLYLSRQIVHNTVGSLPLAKNALHSLTSIITRRRMHGIFGERERASQPVQVAWFQLLIIATEIPVVPPSSGLSRIRLD